jgi:hypothetical protein
MNESFFSVNEEIRSFVDDLYDLPGEATEKWWLANAARIAETAENPKVREIAKDLLSGEIGYWEAHCSAMDLIHADKRGDTPSKDEIFLDEEDAFFAEEAKNFVMEEIEFLRQLSMDIPKLRKALRQKVGNSFDSKINWVLEIKGILQDYIQLQVN